VPIPKLSGYTMVDGETEVADHDATESNRMVIRSFIGDVLIKGSLKKLDDYINLEQYTEHNPRFGDDLVGLTAALSKSTIDGLNSIKYKKYHRLLAEGNFVLSVCEGQANQTPSSFFDLYRLRDGKIIEHWDTTEAIPSRDKWKNNNGKF